MKTIGLVLMALGAFDAFAVGPLIIGPRIQDEKERRVIIKALMAAGVLMMFLGAAIYLGFFGG
ncbi:MAG: hypothetical protein HYT79_08370 [Elusimicrobia bacterium]|nr:hypothetical protein [Elusimicrobiota bacterium]